MRILHAYNIHRGGGGGDNATTATITVLRQSGIDVDEFIRDSRAYPDTLTSRVRAFAAGLYARDAVAEFTERLRRTRPDVVHVHELYPFISPWILPACRHAGIPAVMTCYDFRLTCPIATHHSRGAPCFRCQGGREYWCVLRNCRSSAPESLAYALRNASARVLGLYDRNVSRFVALSDHHRAFLIDHAGIEPRRVTVNFCVIPAPDRPVDDPAQGQYVGFAGRFVHEKGVHVMVEACRRLGLPMRFAGNAMEHPAVRPDDNATFVMTRSPDELAAFYRGARVMVVPSIWAETFGIVAGEAMSHGVPVVASRLGALDGTVIDNESGLLARPGDVDDFADKIAAVWNAPELARRLGAGARRRVLAEFSPQAHLDRLLAVYAAAREDAGRRAMGDGP